MIEVRPSTANDAYDLFLNLHPMTRNEIENAGIAPGNVLTHIRTAVCAAGSSTVEINGEVVIVAYSMPLVPGKRTTGFLAANCRDGRKLTFAARRWAARERMRHPNTEFIAASFSTHPERDRFLEALGMHKVEDQPTFTLFSDSRPALDMAQPLL